MPRGPLVRQPTMFSLSPSGGGQYSTSPEHGLGVPAIAFPSDVLLQNPQRAGYRPGCPFGHRYTPRLISWVEAVFRRGEDTAVRRARREVVRTGDAGRRTLRNFEIRSR